MTVCASSRMTSASVLPLRFNTWNEWSAVSKMCSAARGASFAHSGRMRDKSANVSRVPCKNSIGSATRSKCSARFVPGWPGGCSGNPKKTRPRTRFSDSVSPEEASGSAKTCEVMRPPSDLPPASSGNCGNCCAAAMAARTVAARMAGGSGLPRPFCM